MFFFSFIFVKQTTDQLLDDILGLGSGVSTTTCYIPPMKEWLSAGNAKGLEIKGTFARRSGKIFMDMTFTNKVRREREEGGSQIHHQLPLGFFSFPIHYYCRP